MAEGGGIPWSSRRRKSRRRHNERESSENEEIDRIFFELFLATPRILCQKMWKARRLLLVVVLLISKTNSPAMVIRLMKRAVPI